MIQWLDQLPRSTRSGPVLVVDGGGTRCRVVIAGVDGTLLAHVEGGPTNARSVGDEAAATALTTTISAALQQSALAPDALTLALVTSAAVDTLAFSSWMAQRVESVALPGASVAVLPDTVGCWAVTGRLGPAVSVISGTGSVVLAGDLETVGWHRYGGWDYLLGDEGSGFGLARAALQEALRASEGRSDAAALEAEVCRAMGVEDADAIPDRVHKPTVDKAWIADLARVVVKLAESGDAPSRRVVTGEVAKLADDAAAGLAVLAHRVTTVGAFGGNFSSDFFSQTFTAELQARSGKDVVVTRPESPALVGAYLLARWACGAELVDIEPGAQALTAALDA